MRAISSSVTLSRRSERALLSCVSFSCCSSSFFKAGILPYCNSAALFKSYSRWACSNRALAASNSWRSFWTLPIAFFSLSHCAFFAENSSRISDNSRCIRVRCSPESASSSFFKAASSISCWIIFLWIISNSVGMESISVLIMAQASSTKSIALSGKNRSDIYLSDSVAAAINAPSVIFTPW